MNQQPQSDVIYRDSVDVVSMRGEVHSVQAHDLRERLAERQLRLAVVVPEGGLVTRVLRIVNLKSVAPVHTTVNDAVAEIHD